MNRLTKYFRTASLHRQARIWLTHSDPVALVARCLFYLNRQARKTKTGKDIIYEFKNFLVEHFYKAGYCYAAYTQNQHLDCWQCAGTGDDGWHDHEPCWHCGGSGIYKTITLYVFRFDIHGYRYTWHQPARLVTWPVNFNNVEPNTYTEPRTDYPELDEEIVYLYLAVIYQYLAAQGLTQFDHYYAPAFWQDVVKDTLFAIKWRWRAYYRPLIQSKIWELKQRNAPDEAEYQDDYAYAWDDAEEEEISF